MDNFEATAYAVVALNNLQKENREINKQNLSSEMMYLMDIHSKEEILKKADNCL